MHTSKDPEYLNKVARLKQIRDLQAQYPGRAPGGTGLTGLMSTDARGWSAMLNEQTEAENIENELEGKAPLRVKVAPFKEYIESTQPQSTWMREQGRNDRRRQLAQLDAIRAAGRFTSRT